MALLVTACGSNGSTGSGTSSPLSSKTVTIAPSDVKVANPATAPTQPLPTLSKATGSPVTIGFPYADWNSLKQAGYPVAFRTDDAAQIQAFVAWANAHGGIAGHPIVADAIKVNIVDPNATQAACLQMTQQEKVFTVIDVDIFIGNPACVVQQNNTPMWSASQGSDATYLAQFPKVSSEVASLEQSAADLISGGAKMGFFSIPGKLGILRNGCDPTSVWDGPNGIHALLKQLGITSSDYVEYKDACDGAATAGQTAGQALLAFKADGVTKVIGGTGAAMEKTVSMQGEQQGFKPAWLIGDFNSTIQNTNLLNNDDITNAYGVSGTVLNYANSPEIAYCNAILTQAGLSAMTSPSVDLAAAFRCDAVVQMVQIGALMTKGAALTQQTYAAAEQKAGNLFSAQSFGVTYGPDDLLGGDKVGLFRYNAGAKDWDMQGSPVVAPHVLTK